MYLADIMNVNKTLCIYIYWWHNPLAWFNSIVYFLILISKTSPSDSIRVLSFRFSHVVVYDTFSGFASFTPNIEPKLILLPVWFHMFLPARNLSVASYVTHSYMLICYWMVWWSNFQYFVKSRRCDKQIFKNKWNISYFQVKWGVYDLVWI